MKIIPHCNSSRTDGLARVKRRSDGDGGEAGRNTRTPADGYRRFCQGFRPSGCEGNDSPGARVVHVLGNDLQRRICIPASIGHAGRERGVNVPELLARPPATPAADARHRCRATLRQGVSRCPRTRSSARCRSRSAATRCCGPRTHGGTATHRVPPTSASTVTSWTRRPPGSAQPAASRTPP